MKTAIKYAMSAAVFAAAVTGSALSASAASEGFNIPVPTAKPNLSYEVAQADSGVGAGASTSAPDSDTTAQDQLQQPDGGNAGNVNTTDTMGTAAIEPTVGVSSVSDFAVVDVATIHVTRVDELTQKRERDHYITLGRANEAEVQQLQASIMANPELVAALEAQEVQVNNIVAAHQNADGSVTFFVL